MGDAQCSQSKNVSGLKICRKSRQKKNHYFHGGHELELYDITDRDDFVWLLHTEPSSAESLRYVNQHLQQGKLWEEFPFISCSLQDGFTESYAGNQSIVHGLQAFPISFLLEVDPNAIINITPHDARTPEGRDKTRHLKYVQPTISQRLAKDQSLQDVVPRGTVAELQAKQDGGLSSQEQLLKKTSSYNEVTIVSGELAKDWGVKPVAIKGIVIDKKELNRYIEDQDNIKAEYLNSYRESPAEIIKFAKNNNLPVILIEPKPSLKKSIRQDALDINRMFRPESGVMRPKIGNYFKKELEHYVKLFKHKASDTTDEANKAWFQQMGAFLEKVIVSDWSLELPQLKSLEEQVLISIITAEANLEANRTQQNYIEAELKTLEDKKPNDPEITELKLWSKDLANERTKVKSDLTKYQKELSKHQPDLKLDIEGLSDNPKSKK